MVVPDLTPADKRAVVANFGDLARNRVGREIIETLEIHERRVAAEPCANVAADIESRPCEGGSIGGRREYKNGQAGEVKTQSSKFVHCCSPARPSPQANPKHCFGKPTVTLVQQVPSSFSAGISSAHRTG